MRAGVDGLQCSRLIRPRQLASSGSVWTIPTLPLSLIVKASIWLQLVIFEPFHPE